MCGSRRSVKWMFGVGWDTAKAVKWSRVVEGKSESQGERAVSRYEWGLCLRFIPEDMPRLIQNLYESQLLV